MDLRVWVRADDADESLLVLSAPDGTPLGQALGPMSHALGVPGPLTADIDGVALPDDAPLGSAPLIHGARVRVRSPRGSPRGVGWEPPPPVPGPDEPSVAPHGAGCLVRVVAGRGAGAEHRLAPGTYLLGRGEQSQVRMADPGVSRRHALLRVGARAAIILDLGSSNGTHVDGQRVGARPQAVRRGARVRMGSTTWALEGAGGNPAGRGRATGAGSILINRAPRVVPTARTVRLRSPRPPEVPPPGSLPLLMVLLPPAVSIVAAVILRQPTVLLFGLMGPAMSLGAFVADRRGHRRRQELADRRHGEARARHRADLAEALSRWRRDQERNSPGVADAGWACAQRSGRLWQRNPGDPDWLRLRIGRGAAPADVVVLDPDGGEEAPQLRDLPIAMELAAAGVVGLAPAGVAPPGPVAAASAPVSAQPVPSLGDPGHGDAVRAVAGALLAQCVAWQGPAQLHIWVLAARGRDLARWHWLTQAPHVVADGSDPCGGFARVGSLDARGDAARRLRELDAILEQRQAASAGARGPSPIWHLVVLDGARELLEQPGTAALLRTGRDVGIVALCLGADASELPAECAQVVLVRPDGVAHLTGGSPEASGVVADLADRGALEAIGSALAPLEDGVPAAGDGLPDQVALGDILEVDPRVSGAVAAAWRRRGADTTVDLGRGAGGPAQVDLRLEGPHALVGGTTGSGKSELLRTLIASLALRNRPDRLCFVLVDYKGGSAFDACARLPHTVGVVTDLDGAAAERALTGLRAELRRREELLRCAGVSDLEGYAAAVDAGARDDAGAPLRHLPRMVLVFDEFRALAEELPDFVTGVVRFAALGRSLGIHLVLATQRPAGIVSADIRANVGLRIALRVRDAADSVDVVESPAAADLPARRPGRALARSGGGGLIAFQTARLGTSRAVGRPEIAVRLVRDELLGAPWEELPVGGRGPLATPSVRPAPVVELTLDDVVRASLDASAELHVPLPPPPWLPPLPERLAWRDLSPHRAADASAARPGGLRPCCGTRRPTVLFDDPERQSRRPWGWTAAAGHLGVIGRGRSGRTQALRTLATAAAEADCPATLSLHLVDAGGGLHGLSALPHTASHVTLEDPGALRRLVQGLRDRTRARAGAVGEATPVDDDPSGAAGLPGDLLVIDGWDQVRAVLEGLDHGAPLEELIEAARAGTAGGLCILAAGGRGLLTGGLAACLGDRLVLDLSDPTDALLAGLGAQVAAGRPPGRAVLASNSLVGQITLLDPRDEAPSSGLPTDLAEAIARRHAGCPPPGWGIRPLPAQIRLPDLQRAHGVCPAPAHGPRAWLGLRGDGGALPVPLSGPGWLVCGPRGSGRTTTLHTIAVQSTDQNRPTLWCSGRPASPGEGHLPGPDVARCGPDGAVVVSTYLRDPEAVVLVDDLEDLTGSPLDTLLSDRVASGASGACVIAAGRTAELAGAFRGLAGALRRHGHGVVLGSGGRADDIFALAIPRGEPNIPGRGAWVAEGHAETVQVALP